MPKSRSLHRATGALRLKAVVGDRTYTGTRGGHTLNLNAEDYAVCHLRPAVALFGTEG